MITLGAPESQTDELSLFQLLNPEVLANPYPLYDRLRTEDPVHWDPYLHTWVVTRYKDVLTVLHDYSANRSPTPEQLASIGLSNLSPIAKVLTKQMLFLDPPAHTRIRTLAAEAFMPARVEALRVHIQEIANSLLNKVQAKGRMEVIADFAVPLPAIVTAEMLGMPTRDYVQLKEWTKVFAEVLGNFQHNPGRAAEVIKSLEEMTEYFRAAIADLKVHPREGVVHSLMTAEVNGDCFTEEEVIANSIIIMAGGQETTTNLIATGLLTLLRNPDQMARLKSDSTLLPSAIEELLRFEPPVLQTARLAPADSELGGKIIAKRQAVIAVMAAANRDPERFHDPNRLDLGRQDNRHLAFGWAAHFCFGAALARIEGQIAFETILRRLPGLVLDPGPLTWRNNQGLRGLEALPLTFRPASAI